MSTRLLGRVFWSAIVGAILALACPNQCQASNMFPVDPGYDLFHTIPIGTTFNGIPFHGVPLGMFSFGGGPPMPTGDTDTIVRRTDRVLMAGGMTHLDLQALQLVSSVPVNGHFLYVTINKPLQMAWQANPEHN